MHIHVNRKYTLIIQRFIPSSPIESLAITVLFMILSLTGAIKCYLALTTRFERQLVIL